jgi:exosortase E/protease (VPEID-CTERM system)
MTESSLPTARPQSGARRLLLYVALFVAELVALAASYQLLANMDCSTTSAAGACGLLRGLVVRALVVLAAAGVLAWAYPVAVARFLAAGAGSVRWAILHVAGLALLVAPLAIANGKDLSPLFAPLLPVWLGGGAMAAIGGLFWVAPPRAWRGLLSADGWSPVPVLVLAAFLPDLAEMARPLWDWQVLTAATFEAVHGFLRLFSDRSFADPESYVMGVGFFAVHIARACSGVEGVALVCGFCALYAFIFRRELRLARFFLVMLPLGILASWTLNVVRIGTLVLIGATVSPDLAVNGFHSYAGWLFFTLLALAIVAVGQSVPWFWHDAGPRVQTPLRRDFVSAAILPFVAFMVAGTATRALLPVPALGDPLIALVLLAAVGLFLPALRALPRSIDGVGLAAGLAVGVAWIALAEAAPAGDPLEVALSGLGAGALGLWVALRFAGTALLVPVVEEMFFRGYLMPRIAAMGASRAMPVVALVVSSLAFGALHGRWVEGTAAGVVFALVAMRRGRVTDAIQSHVAANVTVAVAAILRGDFTLI